MAVFAEHLHQFLILAVLLGFSAFFSGSETAYFSLTNVDLRRFRRRPGTVARAVTVLSREPSAFLATVLFCNMLVNVLFFSISSMLAVELGREGSPTLGVGFSAAALLLIIIAGEVAPKSLAVVAPSTYIRYAALPMFAFHRAVSPVRRALRRITDLVERLALPASAADDAGFEELKLSLQTSAEEGELSENESFLLREVIDLSDLRAREYMTPRVDMIVARERAPAEEILELGRRTGKTKIPVYRAHRDDIRGVVDARELFLKGATGSIRAFVRPLVFVSAYQRADDTLRTFQRTGARLAVVVDEYGGTAGIVTLSDVLEEIFGRGAIDEDGLGAAPPVRELGENRFELSGGLALREIPHFLHHLEEYPPVDTVGGLVTGMLGRIPRPGDAVESGRLRLTVGRMRRRRVETVVLEILPEPETEDASANGRSVPGDAS